MCVRVHTHTQQVKDSIKRVSTSHIPPASQPAALFVDQSRDNKSFYCRVVLPPVPLLFLHSLFLLIFLIQHTLISLKQLCFFSHFLKYLSASVCNFSLPLPLHNHIIRYFSTAFTAVPFFVSHLFTSPPSPLFSLLYRLPSLSFSCP